MLKYSFVNIHLLKILYNFYTYNCQLKYSQNKLATFVLWYVNVCIEIKLYNFNQLLLKYLLMKYKIVIVKLFYYLLKKNVKGVN